MTIPQLNAWENWDAQPATCECSWTGLLADAVLDVDSDTITFLLCPACTERIAIMTTFATREQIRKLADGGSRKAATYLAKRQESSEN